MTIHKQTEMPINAKVGDAWTDIEETFKRVFSQGGAWENVAPGSRHPDEVNHVETEERPEAQHGDDGAEVSGGPSEPAPGNGDNGEMPVSNGGGQENSPLVEGVEGVDSNTPPVV